MLVSISAPNVSIIGDPTPHPPDTRLTGARPNPFSTKQTASALDGHVQQYLLICLTDLELLGTADLHREIRENSSGRRRPALQFVFFVRRQCSLGPWNIPFHVNSKGESLLAPQKVGSQDQQTSGLESL